MIWSYVRFINKVTDPEQHSFQTEPIQHNVLHTTGTATYRLLPAPAGPVNVFPLGQQSMHLSWWLMPSYRSPRKTDKKIRSAGSGALPADRLSYRIATAMADRCR